MQVPLDGARTKLEDLKNKNIGGTHRHPSGNTPFGHKAPVNRFELRYRRNAAEVVRCGEEFGFGLESLNRLDDVQ